MKTGAEAMGWSGHWREVDRRRPWIADGLLALLLTTASLPALWFVDPGEGPFAAYEGPDVVTVAVALLLTLPLVWRRLAPGATLLVVAGAAVAAALLLVPHTGFALLVALYTVASRGPRRRAVLACLGLLAAVFVALSIQGQLGFLGLNIVLLGATTLFGDWRRLQRARAVELQRRGEAAGRAREERERLAVQSERERIAAELRDVLAHGVAAMITQAEAATRLLKGAPERAADTLRAVERTGRSAHLEVRRLVALLREGEAATDAGSAPGADPGEAEAARTAVSTPPARPWPGSRSPADAPGSDRWRRLRTRLTDLPPLVADAALAVAVLATEVAAQLTIPGVTGESAEPTPASLGFALLLAAPLVARSRLPRTVLVLTLLVGAGMVQEGTPAQMLAPLVALYTVASRYPRNRSVWWLLLTLGLTVWALAVEEALPFLLGTAAVVGAAWLLGDHQRVEGTYRRQLQVRAEELEQQRERQIALALAEERARIARELHDVIAHSIGVMTVQARGAVRVLESDPQRAREATEQVVSSGRESLRWLREVLPAPGVEDGGFAPQPALDDLEALLADVRAAGVPVELLVEGEPRELSSGVSLSAYRIIQEALTNVITHSRADTARVRLVYGDEDLRVEIDDDGVGPGPGAHRTDGGHGLVGMAERARLVGGSLEVGSRPGGGFRVTARLPLSPEPSLVGR